MTKEPKLTLCKLPYDRICLTTVDETGKFFQFSWKNELTCADGKHPSLENIPRLFHHTTGKPKIVTQEI